MISPIGFVVGIVGIGLVLAAISVNGFLGFFVAVALMGLAFAIEEHS